MNTRHPPGIPGSKPRLPKPEENGEPASKEEIQRLSHEYLINRNRQMVAKAFMVETQAARARGELIDRKRAFASGAYIVTCFRQRALLAHTTIARRLVTLGLVDETKEHAVSEAIREDIHTLLTEIANLPEKALNPNWLAELERKETGITEDERQKSPAEHKHAQAQAEIRRQKKTESQRKRREEGRS